MGNVESRPRNRPVGVSKRRTARPLPPLPDDDDDEYDLDAPPPYPPPPPPLDENGGKSKRISWRFRESGLFGGFKRGAWALHAQNERDFYNVSDERSKYSQTNTGKDLSNTVALEDNNVVTVSVIGTPDKNDWSPNSNSKISNESPQNSWAVKNMQLVLDKEMQGKDLNSSTKYSKSETLISSNNDVGAFPYPDVQNNLESDRSSLPDLVSVKSIPDTSIVTVNIDNHSKLPPSSAGYHSKFSYEREPEDIDNQTSYSFRRLEDVRVDYPEGNAKEISDYNSFEETIEDETEPISLQIETTSDAEFSEQKNDLNKSNIDSSVTSPSKSKKSKLGACFGKRKSADMTEEAGNTKISEKQDSSSLSSTSELSSSSLQKKIDSDGPTPKKMKKNIFSSYFGKSHPSETADKNSDLEKKPETVIINGHDDTLESESSETLNQKSDIKNIKKGKKGNFGSCFGTNEAEKVDIEAKTDHELSTADMKEKIDGSLNNDDHKEMTAELKYETQEPKLQFESSLPQSKKKGKFKSYFGKKNESELDPTLSADDTQIQMQSDNKDILAVIPTLEIDTNNMPYLSDTSETKVGNLQIDSSADFNDKTILSDNDASLSMATDSGIMKPSFKADFKQGKGSNLDFSPEIHFHDVRARKDTQSESNVSIKNSEFMEPNLKGDVSDINLVPSTYSMKDKTYFSDDGKISLDGSTVAVKGEIKVPEQSIQKQDLYAPELNMLVQSDKKDEHSHTDELIDNKSESLKVKNKKSNIGPCSCLNKQPKDAKDVYMPVENKNEIDLELNKAEISGKSRPIEIDLPSSQTNDIEANVVILKPAVNIEGPETDSESLTFAVPKSNLTLHGKISDAEVKMKQPEEIKYDMQVASVDLKLEPTSIEVDEQASIARTLNMKEEFNSKVPIPNVEKTMNIQLPPNIIGTSNVKCDYVDDAKSVLTPEINLRTSAQEPISTLDLSVNSNIPQGNISGDITNLNIDGEDTAVKIERHYMKKPDIQIEVLIPEPSMKEENLEFKNEMNDSETQVKGDVDIPKLEPKIQLKGEIESSKPTRKGKFNLGSCFKKEREEKLDVNEPSIEVRADITSLPEGQLKSESSIDKPKIDVKTNIDAPKLESEIVDEMPGLKVEVETSCSKKKSKATSFFGKKKSVDASLEAPSVSLEGDIKVDPNLKTELITDNDIPEASLLGKVSGPKAKKSGIGSCFGKKSKPETAVKSEAEISSNISVPKSDLKFQKPEIDKKPISKKTKGALCASCVGKSKKSEIDIDIDEKMPEYKLSPDLPAADLKVESKLDVPDATVRSDFEIPEASKDINISFKSHEIEVKDVTLEIPKVDLSLEGKSLHEEFSYETGIEAEPPSLGETTDANFKLKSPDFPESSFDIDVEPLHLDIESEVNLPKIPNFEDTSVNIGTPELKGNLDMPEIISDNDYSVEIPAVSSPELDLDVSVTTEIEKHSPPSLELKNKSPELQLPQIKAKKVKGGPCSCMGKSKKPQGDVYMPASEVTKDVDVPSKAGLTVSVEGDLPEVEAQVNVQSEAGTSIPKTSIEKPKFKLGSCFGKPKTDISKPELEIKADVEATETLPAPEIEGRASVSIPEIKSSDKSSVNAKGGFGSCFGKKEKKSKKETDVIVEASLPIPSGDVQVGVDIPKHKEELSVSQETKADVKVKKPKSNFGSCFGKDKSQDVDVNVPSKDLKGSLNLEAPELKAEGSASGGVDLDVPKTKDLSVSSEAKGDVKVKKPKSKFGSCFGNNKSQDIDSDIASKDLEGSLEVKSPELKIESTTTADVDVPERKDISISPEVKSDVKVKKPKAKFGSCFGKSKSPDIDYNLPSESVVVTSGELKPEVSSSVEIEVPDVDVRMESEVQSKELKTKEKISKPPDKGKLKLGSCFGKKKASAAVKKPDIHVEGVISEPSLSDENLKSKAEVSVPEVEFKGVIDVPKLQPEICIKGEVESPKPSSKGKFDLGSCFGKKKDAKLNVKEPHIEIKSDIPSLPEGQVDADISIASPRVEVKSDINAPKLESVIDVDVPTLQGELDTSASKKKKSKLGSCFGKKKSVASIDAPSGSIEGEIKVDPKLKTEITINDDLSGEALPSKVSEPKTKKSGLGSCFGKKPKSEFDVKNEGEISGKISEPKSDLKLEKPEKDIKVKPQKMKGGLCASCVGKSPKSQIDIDIDGKSPEYKLSSDIPDADLKLESEIGISDVSVKPEFEIPEGSKDINISFESPEIEVTDATLEIPKVDLSLEGKSPHEEFSYEAGIEVETPSLDGMSEDNLKLKFPDLPESSFDIDVEPLHLDIESEVNLPKMPNIEKDISVNIGTPEMKGKLDMPEIISDYDYSVEIPAVSSPELDLDVSVATEIEKPSSPSLELKSKSPELQLPQIKAKKVKGGPCSCMGKSKKPQGDVYMPSSEVAKDVDISSKADLKVNVEGDLPELKTQIDVQSEADTSMPKTSIEKPKFKFGSCFGKPKTDSSKPELEIKADVEATETLPEIEGRASVNIPEIKSSDKSSVNAKGGFGSCFGKKEKKSKKESDVIVEASLPIPSGDVQVGVDIPKHKEELSVSQETKADVKVKKPKSKFGSCFGKDKSQDVDVNIPHKDIKGSLEVKSPELDVEGSTSGGVDIYIPKYQDVSVSPDIKEDVKVKKPKSKFGSCFGKSKSQNIDSDIASKDLEGSLEVKSPELKVECSATEEVDISERIDASPEGKGDVKVKKPKAKFGSCFGKSKSPDIDNDLPSEGVVAISGELKPEVSSSAEIEAPDVDVKMGSEVQLKGPNAKEKISKPSEKGKLKFGSCFGKDKASADIKKSDVLVEVENTEPSLSHEKLKSEAEISVPKVKVRGEIEVPKLESDVHVKGDFESSKPSGKGKFDLGTCFGKKKDTISLEPSNEAKAEIPLLPEVQMEADTSIVSPNLEITSDINAPSLQADIDVDALEFQAESDTSAPKKKKSKAFGSCFGKNKANNAGIEVSPGSVEGDVKIDPELKSDLNINDDFPQGSLSASVSGTKAKKGGIGSCFGKKSSFDVNVQGERDTSINISASKSDLKLDKPENDIDKKPKKIKGGLFSSCGGKSSKSGKDLDIDVESPEYKLSSHTPVVDLKVESNLGVGDMEHEIDNYEEPKDIGINLKMPESKTDLNLKVPGKDIDVQLKSSDTDINSVNIELPKVNLTLDSKCPDTKFSSDAEIEVEKSILDMRNDGDLEFISPNQPEVLLAVDVESLAVKSVEVDDKGENLEYKSNINIGKPELNVDGDLDVSKKKNIFGSCFGKKATEDIGIKTSNDSERKVEPTLALDTSIKKDLPESRLNSDLKESKKKKSGLGSCFGKKSKTNRADAESKLSHSKSSSEESLKSKSDLNLNMNDRVPHCEISASIPSAKIDNDLNLQGQHTDPSEVVLTLKSPSIVNGLDSETQNPLVGIDYCALDSECSRNLIVSDKRVHFNGYEDDKIALNFPSSNAAVNIDIKHPSYNGEINNAELEAPLRDQKIEYSGHYEIHSPLPDVTKSSLSMPFHLKHTDNTDLEIQHPGFVYERKEDSFPEKSSINTHPLPFSDNMDSADVRPKHDAGYENIFNLNKRGTPLSIYENVPPSSVQTEVDDKVETSPSIDSEIFEEFKFPHVPQRWYGVESARYSSNSDEQGAEVTPNTKTKLYVSSDSKTDNDDHFKRVPSEVKSNLQSIDFVKQMVQEDDPNNITITHRNAGQFNEDDSCLWELGPSHISPTPRKESDHLTWSKPLIESDGITTTDSLLKRLEDFDKLEYNEQPIVKRTIKVKTYKPVEGSDEPEEVIEEFELEGEELKYDVADLLMKKLEEFNLQDRDSQPVITRSVKVKTYKTKEGSDTPEEVVEEFEDENVDPFHLGEYHLKLKSSEHLKTDSDFNSPQAFNKPEDTSSGFKTELREPSTSELVRKVAELGSKDSVPVIKKTIKVKTYSTVEGENSSEEVVEEYEASADTDMTKSEATQYLLKKIADFDGEGIRGEPFVKRTIKVKSYKTTEDSDKPEYVEEFEKTSDDMSLSDILHDRFPELRFSDLESSEILKSLSQPMQQGVVSQQMERQEETPGHIKCSINISPYVSEKEASNDPQNKFVSIKSTTIVSGNDDGEGQDCSKKES